MWLNKAINVLTISFRHLPCTTCIVPILNNVDTRTRCMISMINNCGRGRVQKRHWMSRTNLCSDSSLVLTIALWNLNDTGSYHRRRSASWRSSTGRSRWWCFGFIAEQLGDQFILQHNHTRRWRSAFEQIHSPEKHRREQNLWIKLVWYQDANHLHNSLYNNVTLQNNQQHGTHRSLYSAILVPRRCGNFNVCLI